MIKLIELTGDDVNRLKQPLLESAIEGWASVTERSLKEVRVFCEQTIVHDFETAAESANNHFMAIVESKTNAIVGTLWYRVPNESLFNDVAFLCWIGIDTRYRRRGYAKAALRELSALLKKQGLRRISLQVFHDNEAALSLYEALGFRSTRVFLDKALD